MSRITALAYAVVYTLALPVIVFRLLRAPGSARLLQRFSFVLPEEKRGSIWLHASSVGEVALLEPLVAAFERAAPEAPLLITAFTATGVATAQQRFADHTVYPFPFDYQCAVRRFISRLRPRLAVVVESEFWPGFLSAMHAAGVPVAVVNAKMSKRSMRIHSSTGFVARALRAFAVIAVQDEENAAHFRTLGADAERVHVTGNMKFDLVTPDAGATSRDALGIPDDATVIIGGSLHEGEDEVLLDSVFDPQPVTNSIILILAPRYLEFAPRICAAAKRRGLNAALKTELEGDSVRDRNLDVCVVDTFGELRSLYSIADVVFVGGSLFDRGSSKGGHNLMEPAIFAVPVLFGPFTRSFAHIAGELERRHGGAVVRSAAELRSALTELCANPGEAARMGEAARNVVLAGQGATARNLTLILRLLEQCRH